MLRILSIFFFVCFLFGCGQANKTSPLNNLYDEDLARETTIKYSYTKVHSLFDFIGAITGDPHHGPFLIKMFENSQFNNEQTKKIMAEYLKESSVLHNSYQHDGFPIMRNSGQDLKSLFEIRSASSSSLADFNERTAGLIPIQSQAKLFDLFAQFEQIYSPLVWDQNIDKLQLYKNTIEEKSSSWQMQTTLTKIKHFYRTVWPANLPILISLVPVPARRVSSNAHSIGQFESIEALLDEIQDNEDLLGRYTVIVHELSHSFYDAESKEFQQEMDKWFMENSSPFAKLAYKLINEGLATAVGQGWVYKAATGHLDENSWYNDYYINTYAHGLYERVEDYFDNGKTIDEGFVKFAISKYQELFPDALHEYGNLLTSVQVITDGIVFDDREVGSILRKYFNANDMYRFSPIDDDLSFKTFMEYKDYSALFVLNKANANQLIRYQGHIPKFDELMSKINSSTGNFFLSALDQANRAFVVVVCDKIDALPQAFKKMVDKKIISEGEAFVDF